MPNEKTKRATRSGRRMSGVTRGVARSKSGTREGLKTGKLAPKAPQSKGGIPITDDLADRLAAEAEAGYDISRARRVGRKSLSGSGGTSPRLSIRTTMDLYERALALALREGKTVSEIAREALERYVKPTR